MTIGILGGGQLGRMLAQAAYPFGVRVRCFDPDPAASAGHVSQLVVGNYNDELALKEFSDGLDVVTYEFENVPVETIAYLEKTLKVYPSREALEIGQDRLKEKMFFKELGIPIAETRSAESAEEYFAAIRDLGYPVVVKTRRFGYDGKGQYLLKNERESRKVWEELRRSRVVLEQYIPFDGELSLLTVRSRSGSMAFYPLIRNNHREGILRMSRVPAAAGDLQSLAEQYAQSMMERLEYVGVFAIEFFQHDGKLLANEMAPRVHNSGHWTIEGAVTSQFENHIRAILDYPLGATAVQGSVTMVNLIGRLPDLNGILAIPDVHLHLYGKSPRKNRKIGHITIVAGDDLSMESKLTEVLNNIGHHE